MTESAMEIVRRLIHREWDPIGIGPEAEILGEYDNYVPALCQLVKNGASEQEFFELLWRIETEYIGLTGDRSTTQEFSRKMVSLSDQIRSHIP